MKVIQWIKDTDYEVTSIAFWVVEAYKHDKITREEAMDILQDVLNIRELLGSVTGCLYPLEERKTAILSIVDAVTMSIASLRKTRRKFDA